MMTAIEPTIHADMLSFVLNKLPVQLGMRGGRCDDKKCRSGSTPRGTLSSSSHASNRPLSRAGERKRHLDCQLILAKCTAKQLGS